MRALRARSWAGTASSSRCWLLRRGLAQGPDDALHALARDPQSRPALAALLTRARDSAWDLEPALRGSGPDPFSMVEDEVALVNRGILQLLTNRHPMLELMARYYFQVPGKRFRPTVVLLVGQACLVSARPTERHVQLAQIIEMIHTASLAHDDVLDEAAFRRGHPSLNAAHGNKVSILVGDYLLARAAVAMAHLRDHSVTELMGNMIAELVEGEFVQMRPHNFSMETYLRKTYLKTASMIRNASRSAAILSGVKDDWVELVSQYGESLGMAFQITDDVLDFEPSSVTGKPSQGDLKAGIITAPLLLASEQSDELRQLLAREVAGGQRSDAECERIVELMRHWGGVQQARALAQRYSTTAKEALQGLPESHSRRVLELLADKVLVRTH